MSPRLPTRQRCWCEGQDFALFAQMGDLSEGGTFVKTYAPLPEGATTHVRFTLEEGPVVEARATVVWRRLAGSPTLSPGMGLRFDHMEDGHRATLRSFLESTRG
jgi:uncharacterized protein (TIGR02266 family)